MHEKRHIQNAHENAYNKQPIYKQIDNDGIVEWLDVPRQNTYRQIPCDNPLNHDQDV